MRIRLLVGERKISAPNPFAAASIFVLFFPFSRKLAIVFYCFGEKNEKTIYKSVRPICDKELRGTNENFS